MYFSIYSEMKEIYSGTKGWKNDKLSTGTKSRAWKS